MILLIIGLSLSFVAIGVLFYVLYYLNNELKKKLENNNRALLALQHEFTQYQITEKRHWEKETAKKEIRFDHVAKSIKKNEMVSFKDFFRKANVFIIDDIQFIRGKEGLQEEFFHTFNSLFDKSSQIVISSDRAPNKLDRVQDRIKSRLSGGLVVDIGNPDYELKLKILKKKIEEVPF